MVADPSSETAQAFMDLGAVVVREVAKLKAAPKASLRSVPNPLQRCASWVGSALCRVTVLLPAGLIRRGTRLS